MKTRKIFIKDTGTTLAEYVLAFVLFSVAALTAFGVVGEQLDSALINMDGPFWPKP